MGLAKAINSLRQAYNCLTHWYICSLAYYKHKTSAKIRMMYISLTCQTNFSTFSTFSASSFIHLAKKSKQRNILGSTLNSQDFVL